MLRVVKNCSNGTVPSVVVDSIKEADAVYELYS